MTPTEESYSGSALSAVAASAWCWGRLSTHGRGDASGGIKSSSLHEGRRCRRFFRATAIFSV